MPQHPWVVRRPVAHRGFHDASAGVIENTLPAISAAVEHGFAVEIDVRLTGDDRVVAFHDATLVRLTTSEGRVDATDLAALQAAELRSTASRIPTLEAVLDRIGGRTGLFIELKTDWRGSGRLERAVAERLVDYDGDVAVMSFDHWAVAGFRQLLPNAARGLVAGRYERAHFAALPPERRFVYRHLLSAASARPHFIAYDVRHLTATAPAFLRHVFQVPVLTWTVRTPEESALAADRADQIIFEGFDPSAGTSA